MTFTKVYFSFFRSNNDAAFVVKYTFDVGIYEIDFQKKYKRLEEELHKHSDIDYFHENLMHG
jgi:hypothetical protein